VVADDAGSVLSSSIVRHLSVLTRAGGYRLVGRSFTRRAVAGLGLALALAGLVPGRAWRVGRLAVTAMHEAGHAVVAVLAGRKVSAVHLRPDASGVTVHRGTLGRGGRLVTAAAGYPAPGVVGVAGAWLVAGGHARWWLGALGGLGAIMAVLWVRNWFGLALMVALVAGIGWLLASGTAGTETLVGAAVAWYLVLGGLRATLELFGDRNSSDATDLARIARPHLPAVVFKTAFAAVAAGSVAGSALLLLAGR
jgi:Peptidase M50B-like